MGGETDFEQIALIAERRDILGQAAMLAEDGTSSPEFAGRSAPRGLY